MDVAGRRISLIYFVLLFSGLALLALGYRFNTLGFMAAGMIWILVTPFAVKSYVPIQVRTWAIVLLVLGGLVGAVTGKLLGEDIKPIVGLIGGAMLGGIGGWLLYSIVLDPLAHLVFDVFLPKISTVVLFIVFGLGAFWGAISLRDSIPKYFEVVGGGILVGGTCGAFFGILLGAEAIKRQEE